MYIKINNLDYPCRELQGRKRHNILSRRNGSDHAYLWHGTALP